LLAIYVHLFLYLPPITPGNQHIHTIAAIDEKAI
jgi:hypothetical protein